VVAALSTTEEPVVTERIRRQIPEGGRQERLPGGRHRVVQVRVSEAEYEALEARASAVGVSIPRYLVKAVLFDSRMTANERRAWTAETDRLQRAMYKLRDRIDTLIDLGPVPEWLVDDVSEAVGAITVAASSVRDSVANCMRALVDVDQRSRETRRLVKKDLAG